MNNDDDAIRQALRCILHDASSRFEARFLHVGLPKWQAEQLTMEVVRRTVRSVQARISSSSNSSMIRLRRLASRHSTRLVNRYVRIILTTGMTSEPDIVARLRAAELAEVAFQPPSSS